MEIKSQLDDLRNKLVNELTTIQEGINQDFEKITNKPVKDILLKILDRQDKLFEYYVSSREELVKSSYTPAEKKPPTNAYIDSMDMIFKYF